MFHNIFCDYLRTGNIVKEDFSHYRDKTLFVLLNVSNRNKSLAMEKLSFLSQQGTKSNWIKS